MIKEFYSLFILEVNWKCLDYNDDVIVVKLGIKNKIGIYSMLNYKWFFVYVIVFSFMINLGFIVIVLFL